MYYNSQDLFHKTPFGAVEQMSDVTFTIKLPELFRFAAPRLIIQKDGDDTVHYTMEMTHQEQNEVVFKICIPFNTVGLYYYYFDTYQDYNKIYKGYLGEGDMTTKQGEMYQLTVFEKGFETPQDFTGDVMYQIFPDRFYESKPHTDLHFENRVYRENKKGEPYFWANEIGGQLNFDFFGGDLQGITEKIPYLKEMEVGIIYLNPIFEAHSNHRYNTADYMKIDPVLGTKKDFITLCKTAKKHNIKIILDGVFSHTGSDSLYFDIGSRYGGKGAHNNPESKYRSWYDFSTDYPCGYRSWWGFFSLPEVDENSPDFRKFICGEKGVIDTWLSLGADGFRLDVADELPDDFIEDIRTAVKKCGTDKLLLGEVWEDATNKFSYGSRRTYLLGKGLDSVMNYPFRDAVISFIKTGDISYTVETIFSICENYPKPAVDTLMNFLSTHDTERIITNLADEEINSRDRYWQSGRKLTGTQLEHGRRVVSLAYALLFFLPGIPCVYYGDEIAMQGYKDPFNRGYFDWDSKDTQVLNTVKTMAKIRKENPVFKKGNISIIKADFEILCLRRYDETGIAEICVNRSGKTINLELCGETVEVLPYEYAVRCTRSKKKK